MRMHGQVFSLLLLQDNLKCNIGIANEQSGGRDSYAKVGGPTVGVSHCACEINELISN